MHQFLKQISEVSAAWLYTLCVVLISNKWKILIECIVLIYLKEIIAICNNKDAKEIKMQYTLRPAPPFFVVLGGLLSAHLFTKRAGMEVEAGWPCSGPLLRLAEDVARRLLPGNLQVTSSCSHWYRN